MTWVINKLVSTCQIVPLLKDGLKMKLLNTKVTPQPPQTQPKLACFLEKYDELALEMVKLLEEREKEYMAQVEEAKAHMKEASEFVHKKLNERHQQFFLEFQKERKDATIRLVENKEKLAKHNEQMQGHHEAMARDAKEAAEL